jgi:hypothetical protein
VGLMVDLSVIAISAACFGFAFFLLWVLGRV